jgi:CDP-diglyceride synthetase
MKAKSWAAVAFIALGAVAGAVAQYFYSNQTMAPSDLWLLPVFVFLVFLWYRMDASERSYRRSLWLNLSIVGLALVALPYYLFRSRGAKGGAIATLLALLVYLANMVATVVGHVMVMLAWPQ